MIADVVDFLEGRTVAVRSRLRERMDHAATRLDFERAAEIRNALHWLDQVEQPQAVELVGGGDTDAIGFARDGDDAVGVVIRVRRGRVVAREHRFFENIEEAEDGEILSRFLVQHYLLAEQRALRVVVPFAPQDFELVTSLAERSKWLVPKRGVNQRLVGLADQNARHLLESFKLEALETEERAEDPVYALGRDLGLTTVPRAIVCIDISTNQGRDTVGSLVWFEAGRPKKSEYRRYRIEQQDPPPEPDEQSTVGTPDDYAAIEEVVRRFVSRRIAEARPLPDLMLVDGGKGQLGAARKALETLGQPDLPVASLAKRAEEVFLPRRPQGLKLPARSPSLRLLQRARDEAHRFAVTYSRKRRKERTITSELLDIPGIGEKRRRQLLQHFGSLAGVRLATPQEIASLPGFSLTIADRILESIRE